MTNLPPLMHDQRKIDADHLNLLAVFHFVVAGLALAGIGFLFLNWFMMHSIMHNPAIWQNQKSGPPPRGLLAVFEIFYGVFGVALLLNGIANVISGLCIRRRVYRTFSLAVAGFNCLAFPFGTILGIFTIMVLVRDSVVEAYPSA